MLGGTNCEMSGGKKKVRKVKIVTKDNMKTSKHIKNMKDMKSSFL